MVDSARAAGLFKDFHLWTDRPVAGAICHPDRLRGRRGARLSLSLLQEQVQRLDYGCFVWLAPETRFVRHPGDVLRVLHGAPVHASLESDACSPRCTSSEWCGCSLTNYATLMRFCGVQSRSIFTAPAGFWMVHHDAVGVFCDLAWDFWDFCKRAGYVFPLEPLLAYATQVLCGNPYRHTLKQTRDLWVPDRAACSAGGWPSGKPWRYVDPLTGKACRVNPAIVQLARL
jgi:hypothetical protein